MIEVSVFGPGFGREVAKVSYHKLELSAKEGITLERRNICDRGRVTCKGGESPAWNILNLKSFRKTRGGALKVITSSASNEGGQGVHTFWGGDEQEALILGF